MKQIRVSSLETFLLTSVRTVGLPRNLLQILFTLPVSTATAERSFSTLRRLKTNLKTTMEIAPLAWLLCQRIYKPPRQFLKTLLRVKGADQTLVLK